MSGANTRVVAANVLDAVLHRGRSLKAELSNALPKLPDPRDRALVEAAVMAALREHGRYADVLSQWMARPLGARDGLLRSLIYIGLAQLDAMKLPPHAAVDATVEAVRLSGRAHQAGLVNALLRRALREPLPTARADAAWPEWLASRIRNAWPADADSIFTASAETPPMWLRVNRRHIPRGLYAERLTDVGIVHHLSDDLADAIRLDTPLPVHALPGFDEGDVSVQDGSAQRLADALTLSSDAKVLDACAAPGGKAAHLVERHPDLRVLAIDVDERRVRRMQEGFARLGLDIATGVADATSPESIPADGGFDAIVVDRMLPGLDGLATRILGQRVRLGRPLRVQGLPQAATGAAFASAVGLCLFAAHPQDEWWDFEIPAERYPARSLRRAVKWFKDNW